MKSRNLHDLLHRIGLGESQVYLEVRNDDGTTEYCSIDEVVVDVEDDVIVLRSID